ncbi:hypothetical protein SAMN02744778_02447 [Pantoea sp. GL120224-02]|nr:hypothetical protein SAMN02744778_02447 [Pantoea sp. GL120224-02]
MSEFQHQGVLLTFIQVCLLNVFTGEFRLLQGNRPTEGRLLFSPISGKRS